MRKRGWVLAGALGLLVALAPRPGVAACGPFHGRLAAATGHFEALARLGALALPDGVRPDGPPCPGGLCSRPRTPDPIVPPAPPPRTDPATLLAVGPLGPPPARRLPAAAPPVQPGGPAAPPPHRPPRPAPPLDH